MIVYLTGGVGTGKSTVLRMFAELGAITLAADDIVRELYQDPAVQAQIAILLGLDLPLDRQAIADIVFRDADARRQLEAVLHPRVAARLRDERAGAASPIIYEIPLLPTPSSDDLVIAIDAPMQVRLERLAQRGMPRDEAQRRIAAQPTPLDYGKDATHIIVNDGDAEQLRSRVAAIWKELQHGSATV